MWANAVFTQMSKFGFGTDCVSVRWSSEHITDIFIGHKRLSVKNTLPEMGVIWTEVYGTGIKRFAFVQGKKGW